MLKPPFIPGAEGMGNHNAEALGDPHGKSKDQKGDGASGTHGGQGLFPKKTAYDNGVYHIIKLLENVSK